ATAVAIRSAPARRVTGLGPNVVPPVVVPPVVVPPVVVVVEPPVVEPPPPPPPPPPATGQLTLPVLTPVVIRPIELLPEAVNHMAPSEPATMPKSAELPLGRPELERVPSVVILPMAPPSANQRAPSGPA